jgi:hypothetical protein
VTCILHCVDNLDQPCKIVLKDVLHVPLANRSLSSTSALSAQGYQAVLPSSAATFTPGLYFPCSGAAAPRFIRFNTINGLHYISSRHDHPEPLQPTAANAAVRFSRKLGHCSLQNLWDTRKVVTGLESLEDSHFPWHNVIPEAARIGKSTTAPRPGPTQNRPSRPNEVWHMDTFRSSDELRTPLFKGLGTSLLLRVGILDMFWRMDMCLSHKFWKFKRIGMLI